MNIKSIRDRARFLGNPDQMYGVRRLTVEEGRAKGNTLYQVRTGAGLTYMLGADNGLDLTELTYKGVDMCFLSKNGHHSPYLYDAFESESMYNFPGGMMVTCGLMNVGGGNRDAQGVWHPMHGRFHSIPAVQTSGVIEGDTIKVQGKIREAKLFGHALEVNRTFTSEIGSSEITLTDEITNTTCEPVDFMLLYHTNFGFPFFSKDLKMEVKDLVKTTPRTDYAAKNINDCFTFADPVDGDDEQVFFHEVKPADGWGKVLLTNESLKIGVEMSFDTTTLPRVAQWKCLHSGDYVLGIEPTNCFLKGRAGEEAEGTLTRLEPFASTKMQIKLRFFEL